MRTISLPIGGGKGISSLAGRGGKTLIQNYVDSIAGPLVVARVGGERERGEGGKRGACT